VTAKAPPELRGLARGVKPIERVGLLAKTRVPALLIHGDEDRVGPLIL
jgi:hypothetical protein